MGCNVERDGSQTVYTVPADTPVKPLARDRRGYPKVTGWWTRTGKGDSFLIRQENADKTKADVVELSLTQVYAAIDMLNRAIGLPGPHITRYEK